MTSRQKYKLYGIIGSSLRHSLSPLIHNHLFNKYKLNFCYIAFESNQSKLKDVVCSIKVLSISGVNVTFPYKETIIPYLDKFDITAQKSGAVNCIKYSRGKLTGYNTDIFGIRKTLESRLKINIEGKTVLLLGAGGAARACLVELIRQKPDKIIVANRDVSKAKYMINEFQKAGNNTDIKAVNIKTINDLNQLNHLELLINSTSANSLVLQNIINNLSKIHFFKNTKIFDLNYGKRAIPKSHQNFPNRYIDGLYMLSAQAAAGFHIWTGIKVEPVDIYKYIAKILRDNKYA